MVAPRHRHESHACFSQARPDGVELDYIANFSIHGAYHPATFHEPSEYPEVELCCIERDDHENPGEVSEADYERLGINPCWVQEHYTDVALDNASEADPKERDD